MPHRPPGRSLCAGTPPTTDSAAEASGQHPGLRVIALAGLPGAGKTRLARGLVSAMGGGLLSRDDIRGACFHQLANDLGKPRAFAVMLEVIRLHRGLAATWVVEGMPFGSVEQQRALEAAARKAGTEVEWLWLDVPAEVARTRISHQQDHPAPDRTPELVDLVLARFQAPQNALRLDAGQPAEHVLAQALEALGHGRMAPASTAPDAQ